MRYLVLAVVLGGCAGGGVPSPAAAPCSWAITSPVSSSGEARQTWDGGVPSVTDPLFRFTTENGFAFSVAIWAPQEDGTALAIVSNLPSGSGAVSGWSDLSVARYKIGSQQPLESCSGWEIGSSYSVSIKDGGTVAEINAACLASAMSLSASIVVR